MRDLVGEFTYDLRKKRHVNLRIFFTSTADSNGASEGVRRLVSYHFQSQSGQLLLQSGNSVGSLQRQFLLIQISGAECFASNK
jgi:hypothetical protein